MVMGLYISCADNPKKSQNKNRNYLLLRFLSEKAGQTALFSLA